MLVFAHTFMYPVDHAEALAAKDSQSLAELQAKEVIITELRGKEESLNDQLTQLQGKLDCANALLKSQGHELVEQNEVIESLGEEIKNLEGQLAREKEVDKSLNLVNPSHSTNVSASSSSATVDLLDMDGVSSPDASTRTQGAPMTVPTSTDLESKQQEIEELKLQVTSIQQQMKSKDDQIQSLQQTVMQSTPSAIADTSSMRQEIVALQEQVSKTNQDLKDKENQIESLRNELQKQQYMASSADSDSAQGEALKAELKEKNDSIQALKTECSDLTVKLKLSETQRTATETQRSELIKEKESISGMLLEKENVLNKAKVEWEAKEMELRSQVEAANKCVRDKSSESSQELESLQSSLAKKSAEYDMVYAELVKLRSTTSEQQSLNADHSNQIEKLSASLQAEVAKNQEAKKKVRAFVDNLTAEKSAADEQVKALEARLAESNDKNNVMDQQSKVMEMKLSTLREQSALEQEKFLKERQNYESSFSLQLQDKDVEISKLKDLLENSNKNTQAEMQEALRQVDTASKEAEQHKTKRLEARNETIHLVQALEKAQGEADQVQAFLQRDLVPMAYEQVTGIENALMSLETAVGLLSSKKMVKFHSKAQDFIEKRLKTGRKKRGDRATLLTNESARSDGGNSGSNEGSSIGNNNIAIGQKIPLDSTAATDSPTERGRDTAALTPLSQMVGARAAGAPSTLSKAGRRHISGLGDAMELAQNLYNEMNRMRAGIVLLTQSLERLHETVRLDTKCCGGLYELMVASMQQSNNIQRGYAMTADREEDEDVFMTTPASISSSDIRNVNDRIAVRVSSNDSDESKGEFL